MKRKLTALILVLLMLAAALPAEASASLLPGDPLGWVLYSDVVAYINDVPIRSYNIGGYTYVVAEELADYGFQVSWDEHSANGVLRITSGSGKVTADYTPAPNSHRPGEYAMQYLYTQVLTYMAGEPVWAPNIGGRTCVAMDDLAYFFADSYVWDAERGELRMTLREGCAAVIPGDYSFTYETAGYSLDNAVYGEYAMWEFTKRADGSFSLTDSAGATKAVWQIDLMDDRMHYRIHFPNKMLTLAGGRYFVSAPHILDPQDDIEAALREHQLFTFFGYRPDPWYYRGYLLQSPEVAAEIRELAMQAKGMLRVSINGEAIDGLPLTVFSGYYNAPGGREQTYRELYYLYDRRIPLDEVETVRIEIGELPEEPTAMTWPDIPELSLYAVTFTPDGDQLAFTATMKPFAEAGGDLGKLLTAPRGYAYINTSEAYGYFYQAVGHVEVTDGQIELVAERGYSLYEWLFSDDCTPELIALRERHGCTTIEELVRAGVSEGLVTEEQASFWKGIHESWQYNKDNLLHGNGE